MALSFEPLASSGPAHAATPTRFLWPLKRRSSRCVVASHRVTTPVLEPTARWPPRPDHRTLDTLSPGSSASFFTSAVKPSHRYLRGQRRGGEGVAGGRG